MLLWARRVRVCARCGFNQTPAVPADTNHSVVFTGCPAAAAAADTNGSTLPR